jgi:hypothetical protein
VELVFLPLFATISFVAKIAVFDDNDFEMSESSRLEVLEALHYLAQKGGRLGSQ